jgi:hypothetical protein
MDRRNISKSTENLKNQFLSLFQSNQASSNMEGSVGMSTYENPNNSYSSRAVSYDDGGGGPWTENSILKSLLSRVVNELNVEDRHRYQSMLNNHHTNMTVDQMLEIQTEIISAIQSLKSRASLNSGSKHSKNSFMNDDNEEYNRIENQDLAIASSNYLFTFDWQNCLEVHPPPPFDLDSPVVQHMLETWTTDPNKVSRLLISPFPFYLIFL